MIRIHNPHHMPFLQKTEMFLRTGTLCDTTLIADRQVFKAHALVLAWASKRLERQLTRQSPGTGYRCTVDSVHPNTLQQILDYVYNEWVEVPKEDLLELLRAAQHLEVHALVEQIDSMKTVKNPGRDPHPDVDASHCDSPSCKQIPSSDEEGLRLNTPPETHHDRSSARGSFTPSPSPRKPRVCVAAPSPTTSTYAATSTTASLDSSPSTAPLLRWPQPNSSRQLVLSYSDLMAMQALTASQHMMACSYPTPMYPFFHRPFQPQLPSSLAGYPGLLQQYRQFFASRPLTLAAPLVSGLKGKSDVSAELEGTVSQDRERKPKIQSERDVICRHCSKPAVENSWRQTPRSTSSGSEDVHAGCKFCRGALKGKRSQRSLRRGLGGEKPYQCKHCSKRFSLKHQLDTHLRVHTGEKPFECRMCGQRSRDYSAMIKHLRTHGGATPYQCTLCLEFCSSLASMQKHLKAHPSQDFPPNWSLSSTYLYTCHT
ncbi:uncharacterized protein zbtb32 [Brachyhypopomus gauderio]|uniref:uncharacterized protein zbtb32 n=1 Tax=Brachyhypopomus gauderio TaxID=698409 RepID=UPI00404272B2